MNVDTRLVQMRAHLEEMRKQLAYMSGMVETMGMHLEFLDIANNRTMRLPHLEGVPLRAYHLLEKAGYRTEQQIMETPDDDLRTIRGMGKGLLREVRRVYPRVSPAAIVPN
jgi:DNA-directed RNA polymerase alpha subunit